MNSMALVSAPMITRRFGLAIEANPLGGRKVCSFNCTYCDLGPSEIRMNQLKKEVVFPEVAVIDEAVRIALRSANQNGQKVDSILLSGNGEPTLHPEFDKLVEKLLVARHELSPESRLLVLSNGAHLDTHKIIAAMNNCDERILKVDAGNDTILKQVNDPLIRATVERMTAGARKLNDFVAQSLFYGGPLSNATKDQIDEWLELIGILRPKLVQIYTLNRPPRLSECTTLNEDELYTIESRLKRKLNMPSRVFAPSTSENLT
jgi:wyosine [tRNA(Phe)-imidazoG37] synthetase (radical SAM superfamily)